MGPPSAADVSNNGSGNLIKRGPLYPTRRPERLTLDAAVCEELNLVLLGGSRNNDQDCVTDAIQLVVDLGDLQPNHEIQQCFEAVRHPSIARVGVG